MEQYQPNPTLPSLGMDVHIADKCNDQWKNTRGIVGVDPRCQAGSEGFKKNENVIEKVIRKGEKKNRKVYPGRMTKSGGRYIPRRLQNKKEATAGQTRTS